LSDHVKEWIEHCEDKFQYPNLFDSKLYSFEIEACKPDKKVFLEILKRLNEKPEHCIFVDDSQINIDGAKKLGINTILFKNSEQLKKDLALFSIFVN
jgi:putative hydrolase of the HAD superfamily